MNEEEAREFEKSLLASISQQIRRVIELEAIQQVESIQNDLERTGRLHKINQRVERKKLPVAKQMSRAIKDNPLDTLVSLLDRLNQDLTNGSKKAGNEADYWRLVETQVMNGLSYQIQRSFHHYLNYCLVHGLLSNQMNQVLSAKYREELREAFDLQTSGKLKKTLMLLLDPLFYDEIKHGGSVGEFDYQKRLQFLALYNRYLIVIKNARAQKKQLKRQKKTDIVAKREAMAKCDIPEALIISTFSDAASEVALDWAIESVGTLAGRDYLKRLLIDIRKEHRVRDIVVDCDFSFGQRIYSVNPRKNQKQREKLRYTPLEKSFPIVAGGPDDIIVEFRI